MMEAKDVNDACINAAPLCMCNKPAVAADIRRHLHACLQLWLESLVTCDVAPPNDELTQTRERAVCHVITQPAASPTRGSSLPALPQRARPQA